MTCVRRRQGRSVKDRHRVVVVGGGFGGLPACRFLGGLPVDVTLIDRRNHHLFQPLLYQVSTGIISQGQVAIPLRHVLRKHKNVHVELAEVQGFDLDRKVVKVRRTVGGAVEYEVPYDSLIVAAGCGQSYFGHDEFALYAPGMKTIDDALELRRRIFGAFEMAESCDDPAERAQWLTIVVVGAGPTGVELAGQIRELAVRSLTRRVPELRSRDGARAPGRRGQGAARDLRRQPLGQGPARARPARCRARDGRTRRRDRRGRSRRRNRRRHRTDRGAHRRVGRGSRGVAARRRACQGVRRRSRPGRAHRGASRPHTAGPPRGVRGRRHGDARSSSRRRRGRDAGQSARGRDDRAPLARRQRSGQLQIPRPRFGRDDRPLPRRVQRRAAALERPARVGRVDLRAPRVPQRLLEPLDDDHALAALDDARVGVPNASSACGTRAETSACRRRCSTSSSRTPSRSREPPRSSRRGPTGRYPLRAGDES